MERTSPSPSIHLSLSREVWFLLIQVSVVLISTLLTKYSVGVLHSSPYKTLTLIDTERTMINTLQLYIQAENERLESIRKNNENRKARQNTSTDPDEFSSNPLAVYSMIKYLTDDFKQLREDMMNDNYQNIILPMSQKSGIVFPTDDDFVDIVLNLVNLQRVYDIEINNLMNGNILDHSSNTTLSVADCIEIGKVCAEHNEHLDAVNWLLTCLPLVPEDDYSLRGDIWNVLIKSYLYLGEKQYALTSVQHLLHMEYEDLWIHDLDLDLRSDLNELEHSRGKESFDAVRACRGDFKNETLTRNLKCRYNHSNKPFLILTPLKEEELSIYPKVIIYREAIYDSEIELLKSESRNLLTTAAVHKKQGAETSADTNYRPSQTAFLDLAQRPEYQNLLYRLEDLSELSMKLTESLQMLNYPPGGYYRVHPDFVPSETPRLRTEGQRVATALFYLNDVTMGGDTVFPYLKLQVQPVKGSVLFWINIVEDEGEQILSRHAACPVIYGEKWAATQWFRERGQSLWISSDLREKTFRWNPKKVPKFWRPS